MSEGQEREEVARPATRGARHAARARPRPSPSGVTNHPRRTSDCASWAARLVEAEGAEQPRRPPARARDRCRRAPAQADSARPQEVGVEREQHERGGDRGAAARGPCASSQRAQRAGPRRWPARIATIDAAAVPSEPHRRRLAPVRAVGDARAGTSATRTRRGRSGVAGEERERAAAAAHASRARAARPARAARASQATSGTASSTLSMRTRSERPSSAPASTPKAARAALLPERERAAARGRSGTATSAPTPGSARTRPGRRSCARSSAPSSAGAGPKRRRSAKSTASVPSTPNTSGVASAPRTPMAWKR